MARVRHGTLTPNVVETVPLDEDAIEIEVLNRDGTAEIYFLVDSGTTDPVVGGDDCDVLVAAINSQTARSYAQGSTIVKLISTAAVKYSVRVSDYG